MTGAVRAYKLLAGFDKNSVDFIKHYAGKQIVPKIVISENKSAGTDTKSGTDGAKGIQQSASDNDTGLEGDKLALYNAVLNGLKNEGADCTAKLLENTDSMEVVNEVLIPALDKIGEEFEKGTLFLPQLINVRISCTGSI